MGNSGRSSRKRDMVRLGIPEVSRRGTKLAAGADACACACVIYIESRDVLEKEDGAPELRLFFLPHLKNVDQESDPLELPASEPFGGGSDRSVLVSDSWPDLGRESFVRREVLDSGLSKAATGRSSNLAGGSATGNGMLSVLWNAARGSARIPSRLASGSRSFTTSHGCFGVLSERRILDDVTTAEAGSMPKPTSSRPRTPLSRFGGDSRPCLRASASATFCFSARLAILRSVFSWSSCLFLARLR